MHYRLTILVLTFLAWILSINYSCPAHGSDSAVDDFVKVYTKNLKSFDELRQQMAIEGTHTRKSTIDKNYFTSIPEAERKDKVRGAINNYQYNRDGTKRRVHLFYDKPSFFDRNIFTNGEEEYVLRKSNVQADYFLEHKVWGPVFETVVKDFEEFSVDAVDTLRRDRILTRLASPDFKITSVNPESDPESGHALIKYTFVFEKAFPQQAPSKSKPKPSPNNIQKMSGWVKVAPDLMYATQSYDFNLEHIPEVKAAFHLTGRNTFKNRAGVPIVEKVEFRSLFNEPGTDKSAITDWSFAAKTWTYGKQDPSLFEIDHYGLGEVKTIAKRSPNYWPYGIVVVALILIGLSIYLKRTS